MRGTLQLIARLVIPFFLLVLTSEARAAIGCTLSNPAQDLKYLFPEMTTYKEEVKEFGRMPNGREMYDDLGKRVGGDLDPIYEAFETPFTLYTIFKGDAVIGIVHGVNVPGRGGVIQVFLSVDPASGTIRELFFQRLESGAAKALRGGEFRKQFTALALSDFYKHDYFVAAGTGGITDRIEAIKPPPQIDPAAMVDYSATLRGVRKNLILLDLLVYNRASEPFYLRAQEALQKVGSKR